MIEKIKALLRKYLTREIITYLIFGVLTTLVNYLVYYGSLALGIDYRIAEVAAWVIAVLFAYVTNKKYVFESKSAAGSGLLKEFLAFIGARLLSFAVEFVFLLVSVELFHLSEKWMKLIVNVIVVILNYVFSKLFIFKKETVHEEADKQE